MDALDPCAGSRVVRGMIVLSRTKQDTDEVA